MTSSGPELMAITEVSNPLFWNSFANIFIDLSAPPPENELVRMAIELMGRF